jgi:hypothetical protein
MLPSGAEMPTVVLPKIAVVSPTREQTESPSREHGVDHPAIKKADDGAFHNKSDQTDHDRRHDQHGKPDIDAVACGNDRRIAAEHQEFAMREVDHPHHAEDDRQSDADQRQAGDGVKDLNYQQRNEIHVHPSQTGFDSMRSNGRHGEDTRPRPACGEKVGVRVCLQDLNSLRVPLTRSLWLRPVPARGER